MEGEVVAKGENRISVLLGLHKFDQNLTKHTEDDSGLLSKKGGIRLKSSHETGLKLYKYLPYVTQQSSCSLVKERDALFPQKLG